jgi:putative membrane protein
MVVNATTVPKWAQKFVSAKDCENIAAAVQRVEKNTASEIVPIIVPRSAVDSHVLPLTFLLLCLPLQLYIGYERSFNLTSVAMSVFVVALAWLLSRSEFWLRLVSNSKDLHLQALARAEIEFYRAGLNRTTSRTGILIFVSLVEHTAVVLADKTIADKLPAQTWDELISQLIRDTKAGHLGQGLVTAIETCGQLVSPHFPIQASDVNEVKDHLLFGDAPS